VDDLTSWWPALIAPAAVAVGVVVDTMVKCAVAWWVARAAARLSYPEPAYRSRRLGEWRRDLDDMRQPTKRLVFAGTLLFSGIWVSAKRVAARTTVRTGTVKKIATDDAGADGGREPKTGDGQFPSSNFNDIAFRYLTAAYREDYGQQPDATWLTRIDDEQHLVIVQTKWPKGRGRS
jgi:hypothetical protein